MLRKLLLLLLFLMATKTYAQTYPISGRVISATDTAGLPGATVALKKAADAVMLGGTSTNAKGFFNLDKVTPGAYVLEVRYMGFQVVKLPVQVKEAAVQVGIIKLLEEAHTMQEVQIIGQIPMGEQIGDTAQFNAAAFKTAPDASAEDLVQKMPGISLQDGKIQAQGEEVQQILVDGKPFFGNDVATALQNLPAEVIDKIQVFEKKSDKAELSGFDDGNRAKTINIVTKPNRRNGKFGKTSAGYGSDDRYLLGGSLNAFNGDRRVTLTGLSNNRNTLTFRGDPGNLGASGPRNGITTTNSANLNFSDVLFKKLEVSGNYAFNHLDHLGDQIKSRDYAFAADSGQVYSERNRTESQEAEHKLGLRLNYKINDKNRLLVAPRFSWQNNQDETDFFGQTDNETGKLNQTQNNTQATNAGYQLGNNILFNHRFNKKGRSLTFKLDTDVSNSQGDSYRQSQDIFYNEQTVNRNLRQHTAISQSSVGWETEINLAEPIGKNGRVEAGYEIGNKQNASNRSTYDFIESTGSYSEFNSAFSNIFKSDYLSEELKGGYQFHREKVRLEVEGSYQKAHLQNDREFPENISLSQTFTSFLPAAGFTYKFTKARSLELNYRTNTSAPSLNQLQDVIDNTNSLHLRAGNPDLKQSFENRFRARYRTYNAGTNRNFFISVDASILNNYITNSTILADTLVQLNDKVVLEKGAQFTRPVNLQGFWTVRTYFSLGQPVPLFKSNLSLNGGINRSNRPGLLNGQLNTASTNNFRLGYSLSSNISEKVDFTLSGSSAYNVVRNSLRPNLNNNYFNQSTRLKYQMIFWKGLVYRTELNHQLNSGLSSGYDNSYLLWNMSLGKKIFRNQQGEISLNVFDLLKENNNVSRNITELYVEDVQSNVLQRYFMLTFNYQIRKFGGK